MRPRLTPPTCMGRRMLSGFDENGHTRDYYWVSFPEISQSVAVEKMKSGSWSWIVKRFGTTNEAMGSKSGPQAAANAAQRYLVQRAELTLKLAGRRVAA